MCRKCGLNGNPMVLESLRIPKDGGFAAGLPCLVNGLVICAREAFPVIPELNQSGAIKGIQLLKFVERPRLEILDHPYFLGLGFRSISLRFEPSYEVPKIP